MRGIVVAIMLLLIMSMIFDADATTLRCSISNQTDSFNFHTYRSSGEVDVKLLTDEGTKRYHINDVGSLNTADDYVTVTKDNYNVTYPMRCRRLP